LANFLLNDFADLVSLSSNSIEFHIFGNCAELQRSQLPWLSIHDYFIFTILNPHQFYFTMLCWQF